MKRLLLLFLLLTSLCYSQFRSPALVSNSSITSSPITNFAPVISNFRIADANSNRVLFDTDKIVTASTFTGFTIAGKTIASITIDAGGLSGYFTVNEAFNFWEQGRTIRYVGGSDITDSTSKILLNFTLQDIKNNIAETPFLRERYVTVAGAGTGDGSLGNEWTFAQALSGAIAGDLVHIQAGNYGGANYTITKSGTSANPIVFQGYKTTPGDITSNYYIYGTSTDSATEMPMFDHADRTTGIWITNDTARQYWIFRNLQAKSYEYGMKVTNSTNCLYERINIFDGGDPVVQQFANFSIRGDNSTVRDCRSVNHSFALFRMTGSYILVENNGAYCNETSLVDPISTDYYLTMRTANSVALNNTLHRDGDLQHLGHGFVLRYSGSTLPMDWNLIEGGWVKNIKQAIQLSNTTYNTDNVIRGIDVLKDYNVPNSVNGGIVIYQDVVGSTFENIRFIDVDEGVEFLDNAGGHTFKNILFDNVNVILDISQAVTSTQNNQFINCTFSSTTNLMNSSNDYDNTNSFENCIFDSISTINAGTGVFSATFTYSDFWNGFAAPTGTGNISVDPQFVDLIDFVPQNVNLNVAPRLLNNEYDIKNIARLNPSTMGVVEM